MITLIAVVCHTLLNISDPVCHEEIISQAASSMRECQVTSQIVIADWKGKSIYHSDSWIIAEIECIPGDYQPKDAI